MYSAVILDHFHRPRNCGPMEGATHQGVAGIPGEGPYMELWFRVEGGQVLKAAYRTYGCPAATACGSLTAELATRRPAAQILRLAPEDLVRLLGGVPEGKEHCPQLAVEALRAALGPEMER